MNKDEVYLRHILDAIQKVESYISEGRDSFFSKTYLQDAIIRQLEIIGEATKRLSNKIRTEHNDIPWRRIAGLRDVLIHDYMGVDISAVWEIVQNRIPKIKYQIQEVFEKISGEQKKR